MTEHNGDRHTWHIMWVDSGLLVRIDKMKMVKDEYI